MPQLIQPLPLATWCPLARAARLRGVGPDLLLSELERRGFKVARWGDRRMILVRQTDLQRLDAELVAEVSQ